MREWFLKEAVVTDAKKGYVSVKGLNQRINIKYQGYAADLLADWLKNRNITLVAPVPNAGNYLPVAIAERLGVDLLAGRKDDHAPKTWTKPITTNERVCSFTTGNAATIMTFGDGTETNDTVAVCDDFLATAETTLSQYRAYLGRVGGIVFVFYAAKLFDKGPKILRDRGINFQYAIGIEQISNQWRIVLSPSYFTPIPSLPGVW